MDNVPDARLEAVKQQHLHGNMARKSKIAAIGGIVTLGVTLVACGGSSSPGSASGHTASPSSSVPPHSSTSSTSSTDRATTQPNPDKGRTLSFPPMIARYSLTDPSTGHAANSATPDPSFTQGFPDAETAYEAPYVDFGTSSVSGVISVEAGQLKPGVDPNSAVQSYFTAMNADLQQQAGHHATADLSSEPAGPLGGQVQCWVTLPFGSGSNFNPSQTFCMWADAATYGLLGSAPPGGGDTTAQLASLLLTFRHALEH